MTMLLPRLVLGAGVAAALMVRGPAIVDAQPGPAAPAPSAADKHAAKELVDEGIAAQAAKDYDKAIELYKRAYGLVPHPLMMFNIGQAHRLAGRSDQAAAFYERYLALDPSGSEAAAARAALDEIRAAETKSTETTAPPVPQDVPPAPTAPPLRALELSAPHRTNMVESPGRTLRLTGIMLGGIGFASVAVGSYYRLRMIDIEDNAKIDAANEFSQPELEQDGSAAERKANIGLIVGGSLVIGGAVAYWLGYRKDQAASTTAWIPVGGGSFTGIALTGSLP